MPFMRSQIAQWAVIIIVAVTALAVITWRILVEGHFSMVSLYVLGALVLVVGAVVRLGSDRAP